MAFSTALFCLLMLSKGFAAGPARTEQYVFMGQSQGGKVVLRVDLKHAQPSKGSHAQPKIQLFTERDGWVRLKSQSPFAHAKRVGGPAESRLEGGFPSALTFNSPDDGLSFKWEAERIGVKKQGYLLADGHGSIQWKGKEIPGMVLARIAPTADAGLVEKAMGSEPGYWRESISMAILPGGTLHLYRQSEINAKCPETFTGGYFFTDSLSGPVENLEMAATAWHNIGLYKLPFAWQGNFIVQGKRVVFRINSERLRNHGNLLLKGRRDGYSKGFIKVDGLSYPAFGMSELTHFMKSQAKVREFEVKNKPKPVQQGMTWETAKK